MRDLTLCGIALAPLVGWLGGSAVGYGALRLVGHFIHSRLLRYRSALPGPWSDLLLELHRTILWSFVLAASCYLSHQVIPLSDRVGRLVTVMLLATGGIQVGRWAGLAYESVVRVMIREERPAAVRLLGVVGKVAVWGFLVLVALSTLGVNVSALLTGLGIGGIAVALAVQSVLGDLLASVAIVLDKPFEVGDFIVVGDVSGTVEEIGLKNSRIRSVGGELWVVPNADLVKSRIRNCRRLEERRVVMTLAVAHHRPVELLQRMPNVVSPVVRGVEGWRFGQMYAVEIGGDKLTFEIILHVRASDYESFMASKHALLCVMAERLRDERIELVSSTQTSFIEKPVAVAS